MNKLDKLIIKYQERSKQRYDYTPIGEVVYDLISLKPKKRYKK